jgi:hypothetical protein
MPRARERPPNKRSGGSDARLWRLKQDAFGFSWPVAVSRRKPLLMSLGLSWISLDSFVRIETFQWVTRLEAGKIFSRAFSLALRGAGTGACGRGQAKAQDWSWRELNLTSDFLQWSVVRAQEIAGRGAAWDPRKSGVAPDRGWRLRPSGVVISDRSAPPDVSR